MVETEVCRDPGAYAMAERIGRFALTVRVTEP